jgi:signal transduction histidine kinase
VTNRHPSRDLLVQYWLRAIRIGIQATALVLLALAAMLVLPGDGRIRTVPYAVILALAAVGGMAVTIFPWERLFASPWGLRCLYAWSVADIVLISLAIAVSGGGSSELFIGYALTTVFFGACYPRRTHPILLAFTFACYLSVLAFTGWDITFAAAFLRLSVIGILALITSFLSGELLRHAHENRNARSNAEHWAALLSSVASAGRSMTLDPQRVVGVAVEATVALGFDAAVLCGLDDEARTWQVVDSRGFPDDFLTKHRSATPATEGIVGLVLRNGSTVTAVDDSPGSRAFPLIGKAGFAALVASPIWIGGWLAAVLIGANRGDRAISPQEVEAFELLTAQAGLALENAHRYEDAHRNVERLEELDRMKSDFLATVSHELRTPLTVIQGTGLTLEHTWGRLEEDTGRELLNRLNANSKTLEGIITALLDFSRIEAGWPEARLEAVDLAPLLGGTVARLEGLSAGRVLDQDIGPDVTVLADALLIDRVAENLLSNAFKHTPPGTPVELSARRVGSEVIVSVRDEGPGIEEEELTHLGERFFRGGDLNTRPKGLGLGLALVREVLDLHGSALEIDSRPGHGSTFSFRLKAVEPGLAGAESETAAEA